MTQISLPDWRSDGRVRRLFNQMGIEKVPQLHAIEFVRERRTSHRRTRIDPTDLKIHEALRDGAVDVAKDELRSSDGLLTYKGRKVLVYIPSQSSMGLTGGRSNYRFHLADCSTLQSMRSQNRMHRYRATRRIDGRAPVTLRGSYDRSERIVEMSLCSNCTTELIARNKYPRPFTFEKYFEQFGSDAPREISYVEEEIFTEEYTPDWAELSERYRAEANWTCQLCRVDLHDHRRLLHVHHVDANTRNNAHDNLRVLCVACHAEQPLHAHLKAGSRKEIEALRVIRGF